MYHNKIQLADNFTVSNQIRSLEFLFEEIYKQRKELEKLKIGDSSFDIIKKIRNISSEVYSVCEITNQLMITFLRNDDRYRGTELRRGFNDNFKIIFKADKQGLKDVGIIYKDKYVKSIYGFAQNWYVDFHDIRTQETHYELGNVKRVEKEWIYTNNNRNGVSKQLYTNPKDTIEISVSQYLVLIDSFIRMKEIVSEVIV